MAKTEFIITLKLSVEGDDLHMSHPVNWVWETIFNKVCSGKIRPEVLNVSPLQILDGEKENLFTDHVDKEYENWQEARGG